ncbi:tRNA-uridine aminocarboxypropyltransferase [Vibrio gallicus]|uniref:tRNA-uridine aminocarboxypropyltransferase n=1 Tax=Vibrio gallicus TaxID=190897 RepID=UPI0021C3E8F4|nr:DTW domain-containing protein [Vibrio gallicus]
MSCQQCGFAHNCVCEQLPQVNIGFELVILYHPNELQRATNTGKLLTKSLVGATHYQWSRTEPPAELLTRIAEHDNVKLLFPSNTSAPLTHDEPNKVLYIILDATWQEAKKMWRQSPWLQQLSQVHIESNRLSQYTLRRNQEQGNLCTFEVGSALVATHEGTHSTQKLERFFEHYLKVFQADRCGHKLN